MPVDLKAEKARSRRDDRQSGSSFLPHPLPKHKFPTQEANPAAVYQLVHDELLLEAPPEEIPEVTELVKKEMEQAYPLAVPMLVDIGCGVNWRDAK